MRIAVAGPGYPPDLGGVETVVRETARALSARGHEVEVWAAARGLAAVTAHRDGEVLVRRFPALGSVRFALPASLIWHVRTHAGEFDVLHLHNYHSLVPAAALLVDGRTPVVVSPHFHGGGHTPLARLLHVPYHTIGARLLTRADAVVAVSAAERDLLLEKHPGVRDATTVVHNGVDSAEIAAADPWPDEPPTALVLGRIEAYKHVDVTVRAFADARPEGAQLVVIGDGPDRSRLAGIARASGAPVRLLGRLDRPEVARWLRTARVVVSMSDHEAFGVVPLEATGAGALALVSDIPAHREVLGLAPPGRMRVVTPSGLPEAVTEALQRPSVGPTPVRSWTDVAAELDAIYRTAGSF